MKNIKKLFALALAMAMTLSLAVNAGAYDANSSDNGDHVLWVQDGIVFEMIEGYEEDSVAPRAVLFQTDYTGEDQFRIDADCYASEGDSINVYIDNSQGNGDLYPVYYLNGIEVASSELMVAKGRDVTVRVSYQDGRNIEGSFGVEVNTRDGHMMNFFIRARQFRYVP